MSRFNLYAKFSTSVLHAAHSVHASLTQSSSMPPCWDPGWGNKKWLKHLPLMLQQLFICRSILKSKQTPKLKNYSSRALSESWTKWLIFHTSLAIFASCITLFFLFPSARHHPSSHCLPVRRACKGPQGSKVQMPEPDLHPSVASQWPDLHPSIARQARCVNEVWCQFPWQWHRTPKARSP